MTRQDLVNRLEARAVEADRIGALAPVGAIIRDILTQLDQVNGWPSTGPDHLLTLEEAAGQLQVTTRWLRETRPPYVVALGDKTLRVSAQRLARWMEHQGNGRR
jgi:hypothetical protein